MENEYPKLEIEQTEFNVVVMKYYSWNHYEEIAHFPYGYKSDEDNSEVAIKKAKDFIDLWKKDDKSAQTIKRYKALVSAQEGYIQFLSSHIDSQTQFMAIHNQFTSVEDVERGIQFRESIAAAKSALSGTNE